jgi:hypothetical protein
MIRTCFKLNFCEGVAKPASTTYRSLQFSWGIQMDVFDRSVLDMRMHEETAMQFAMAYLFLNCLVTIAVVIWIYRDAEARGKIGLAAALIVFLSAFHGISVVLIVMCGWIFSRPKRTPTAAASDEQFEMPSGIVVGPTPNEFLEDLQNHTESDDVSD